MEVLLFSGGIESTCLAFVRRPDICLTIDYGQNVAQSEIRASRNVTSFLGLRHEVLAVDLPNIGSGQLAGLEPIPQASIPEFWPYRNQLLVTLAAMKFAGQSDLVITIGTAKGDASHRDGTVEFVERMDRVLAMQEGGTRLIAPVATIDSIDFLIQSRIDPDLLDMTFSCFEAEYPCGRCRGCIKNEHLRSTYFDRNPNCH